MSYHRKFWAAALFMLASACASSGISTGESPGSRNVITAEEIRRGSPGTALDVVRALRPSWLVKRGPQSVSYEADIVVYLGRARMGGISALSELASGNITSMEFLTPAAANYRFGAGHPHGAIVVSTADPGVR
ncbi:MAG TPA: hypothetical protein VMY38_09080 [Gemmatimonadaceae bacterium]|nr:hypothetical protein [Gemmatimonadaceae bacterium]